jgi:UDP-N-acetylmuramate: L-alanyl-gamma-D-glutamyl-meso-diaminopimelate ligase
MSKIHFIAIGGAVMHNMALALDKIGHQISGSDDQIYEPARSRLRQANILPSDEGWFPEKISNDVDFVILGMHAKKDNPELLHCLESKIKVYSFPEFVALQFRSKLKIVIAGSHGKTTTTSLLMHIYKNLNFEFDYLVGAQLEGFENMVSFTNAPIAIIEGDEYLSSALDLRPKFLHYQAQIVVITGIAWDHYNVFPSFQEYVQAFDDLLESLEENSKVIYFDEDIHLRKLINKHQSRLNCILYKAIDYFLSQENYVDRQSGVEFKIFGKHNMENISAALKVLELSDVDRDKAVRTLATFTGAAKRQESLRNSGGKKVYRDFAHAPSKLKATMQAFREKFKDAKIAVFVELHTYSSLNKDFLPEYKDSLILADKAIVYFDQKAIELKNLDKINTQDICLAFNNKNLIVINSNLDLEARLLTEFSSFDIILFLGSGNFGGLELNQISKKF